MLMKMLPFNLLFGVPFLPEASNSSSGFPASAWSCRQIPYSDQVVGRRSQREHPSDAILASVPCLPHQPDRFEPPEDLFNALSFPLAHEITRVTGRAGIKSGVALLLSGDRKSTRLNSSHSQNTY